MTTDDDRVSNAKTEFSELIELMVHFAEMKLPEKEMLESDRESLLLAVAYLKSAEEASRVFSGAIAEALRNSTADRLESKANSAVHEFYDFLWSFAASAFDIGTVACLSRTTVLTLGDIRNAALKTGRSELSKKGRACLQIKNKERRAKIEAAIRSMGTFAKSDTFAKRAAIVVLQKTGYDIPWQTIKSSYLLKMDRQEIIGAA